ncbi:MULTISPECIES: ABC transporter permease [Terrisporobacter]|uniref:Tungstate uptake system permease protein TupB n=2 Tax=Terrisporobacter TaxID=1505652 RepID=A0ABZ3F861_9FIRM|nr:ABC transporter permease [Terrisporobacter sp.]
MEMMEVIEIVIRSLYVTITATCIAIIIGVFLSILIYLNNFAFKKSVITVINSLMSTPPVIMGLIVFLLLSRRGPLGEFQLLFTSKAMIIAQVFLLIPICMSLTLDFLNKFGEDILDTCKILQASKNDTIIIFIREIKYNIITVIIATFSRGISEVGAVMLVGGNVRGKTRVMTTYIAQSTSMGNFDESLMIASILISISFLSTYFIRRLQRDE